MPPGAAIKMIEPTDSIMCPVCLLYLRPGMTLKSHLESHPKQKVIEALVRLADGGGSGAEKQVAVPEQPLPLPGTSAWQQPPPMAMPPPQPATPGSSFIYQQFMSSSQAPQQGAGGTVIGVNQMGQQYVTVPTVFNLQMMCQPYVYQQQQVIMSSQVPPRLLPIEQDSTAEIKDHLIEEIDDKEDPPDLVIIEQSPDGSGLVDVTIVDHHQQDEEDEPQLIDDDELEGNIKADHDLQIEEQQIIAGGKILGGHMAMLHVTPPPYDDMDREMGSPSSNAGSDYIKVRTDLNKSCQTVDDDVGGDVFEEPTFITADAGPVTVEGVMVINGDYVQGQIVGGEDFDFRCERPRILMNLGDYSVTRDIGEESISVDSANMRADEHMPARGELSGQESNASDVPWSKGGSSNSRGSYDLMARETWDGSDASDNDVPPLQSRDPIYDDVPTVSGYSDPPIQYRCPTCGENFSCPKERKAHQLEVHKKDGNEVGGQLGKKKVKKIVIKPKKVAVKTENNFDNVFKLKMENMEAESERSSVILQSQVDEIEVDKVDKTEDALVSVPTVCMICDSVLMDNNALKQHLSEVHNVNPNERYKCTVCGETFPCEPKYTEHLNLHPLECRICGKCFFRRQNLQLHMKRHLGIKPYKCIECAKSFLTKQKLDEHKNVHTGETPIKCNLCDETFRRHSNLVQHRNRHHYNIKKKTKDYICSCGEVFHSKKKLAWHKEIHDNKPKACTHCSEKFIHTASLTRHMRRAHNERFVPKEERSTENVECPICKGVYLRSSLEVHIRNHSGHRPYTCLICSKDFTTKWNLKLHKWTHAARQNKPFKCDMCHGAFIRKSDYVAHMNSHKSIKPYTCNHCGAQFIRKYNCQRHVREHEKGKTFSCTVCGKDFHRSYYLKDHMRIHSGVRPYACHICGKTSTTKSNHNKHVRIHHAREPVSTEN